MGIPDSNILIADNGKEVEITNERIRISGEVPAGMVFVDGSGVGDVGSVVLRDRKRLAEDGIIIIGVTIEKETGEVLAGPDVVTRGFVYVRESEQLMNPAAFAKAYLPIACMNTCVILPLSVTVCATKFPI